MFNKRLKREKNIRPAVSPKKCKVRNFFLKIKMYNSALIKVDVDISLKL